MMKHMPVVIVNVIIAVLVFSVLSLTITEFAQICMCTALFALCDY